VLGREADSFATLRNDKQENWQRGKGNYKQRTGNSVSIYETTERQAKRSQNEAPLSIRTALGLFI
jgi:hypothetical protein